MKNRTSPYHIAWYIAIALTILLAITHSCYWYVPIVVYLIAATVSIVILAMLKDNVKNLPKFAKKAFKMTICRR